MHADQYTLCMLRFSDPKNPWKDECGNIFTAVPDDNMKYPEISALHYFNGRYSYCIKNESYIECNNLNIDLNSFNTWTIDFWIYIPKEIEEEIEDLDLFIIKMYGKSITIDTMMANLKFTDGVRGAVAVKSTDMVGRFIHRAIVKNNNILNYYYDGYLVSTAMAGGSTDSNINNFLLKYSKSNLIIGGGEDAQDSPYCCYIDDFRISNIARFQNYHYEPIYEKDHEFATARKFLNFVNEDTRREISYNYKKDTERKLPSYTYKDTERKLVSNTYKDTRREISYDYKKDTERKLISHTYKDTERKLVSNTYKDTRREISYKYIHDLERKLVSNTYKDTARRISYNYKKDTERKLIGHTYKDTARRISYNFIQDLERKISYNYNNDTKRNLISYTYKDTVRRISYNFIQDLEREIAYNYKKDTERKLISHTYKDTERKISYKYNIDTERRLISYINKDTIRKILYDYKKDTERKLISHTYKDTERIVSYNFIQDLERRISYDYNNDTERKFPSYTYKDTARRISYDFIQDLEREISYNYNNDTERKLISHTYKDTERKISYKYMQDTERKLVYNLFTSTERKFIIEYKYSLLYKYILDKYLYNGIKFHTYLNSQLGSTTKDGQNKFPKIDLKRKIERTIIVNFKTYAYHGDFVSVLKYNDLFYNKILKLEKDKIYKRPIYRKLVYRIQSKIRTYRNVINEDAIYSKNYNMGKNTVAFVFNTNYELLPEYINIPYLPKK